jgi:hypothetical protein
VGVDLHDQQIKGGAKVSDMVTMAPTRENGVHVHEQNGYRTGEGLC